MKQKRTRLVLITSALLSAVLLTSCSSQTPEVSPTSADSCERAVTAGLSAYELWITQGNTGSLQDFFDSLVGVHPSVRVLHEHLLAAQLR